MQCPAKMYRRHLAPLCRACWSRVGLTGRILVEESLLFHSHRHGLGHFGSVSGSLREPKHKRRSENAPAAITVEEVGSKEQRHLRGKGSRDSNCCCALCCLKENLKMLAWSTLLPIRPESVYRAKRALGALAVG